MMLIGMDIASMGTILLLEKFREAVWQFIKRWLECVD